MRVKLTYLIDSPCFLAHFSQARPGKTTRSMGGIMSHDEAKAVLGTPCDPCIIDFWEIVDESQVMSKIEVIRGLGHDVEVEYLSE